MNQIIISPTEVINQRVCLPLTDERAQHLKNILHLEKGADFKVAVIGQGRYLAIYEGEAKEGLEFILNAELPFRELPPVHLIIGLSRPPTIKKILEHATVWGISSFHFWKTDLSDKSYLQSKLLLPENYRPLLWRGLSQSSCFMTEPQVHVHQQLPNLDEWQTYQKFLLSIGDEHPHLLNVSPMINSHKPVVFAIGSERGHTSKEELIWRDRAFQPIQISSSILRVEMATFAVLSQWDLAARLNKEN